MHFTHYKGDKKIYEISLSIKAFQPISNKDKDRINKIALLIGSLGYNEDITEEQYRFNNDMENEELLLDVEVQESEKSK
jgi:hypothetical protein